MNPHVLGGTITVNAAFNLLDGSPADPTTLTLTIEHPDGTKDEIISNNPLTPTAPVIRTGIGVYKADIELDAIGRWTYWWVGTGTAAGANDGEFYVTSRLFDSLSFLTLPSDFDEVRALLGVSKLDLTDEVIKSRPFAPHAELKIKDAVPTWTDLLPPGTPEEEDQLLRLQMAAQYETGALIAETYARGGMVGLQEANIERDPEEWIALAALLRGYYHDLLNDAIPAATPAEAVVPTSMIVGEGALGHRKKAPWAPWTRPPQITP